MFRLLGAFAFLVPVFWVNALGTSQQPNPSVSDCNFVTTAASGLDLVNTVDHPGFGLHLDVSGMPLQGDPLMDSIHDAATRLVHFHASAPYLGELEDKIVDHQAAANALFDIRYAGYVSIEMRAGVAGTGPENITHAIRIAREHYTIVGSDGPNLSPGDPAATPE